MLAGDLFDDVDANLSFGFREVLNNVAKLADVIRARGLTMCFESPSEELCFS